MSFIYIVTTFFWVALYPTRMNVLSMQYIHLLKKTKLTIANTLIQYTFIIYSPKLVVYTKTFFRLYNIRLTCSNHTHISVTSTLSFLVIHAKISFLLNWLCTVEIQSRVAFKSWDFLFREIYVGIIIEPTWLTARYYVFKCFSITKTNFQKMSH